MKKKWYSIRTVHAETEENAIEETINQAFDESDSMCDKLVPAEDFKSSKECIEAFTHWLYYAESDFIKKAWAGNEWMGKHLQEKLNGFMTRFGNGLGMGIETLVRWHQELDQTNQAILYKYIMENHLNKWR